MDPVSETDANGSATERKKKPPRNRRRNNKEPKNPDNNPREKPVNLANGSKAKQTTSSVNQKSAKKKAPRGYPVVSQQSGNSTQNILNEVDIPSSKPKNLVGFGDDVAIMQVPQNNKKEKLPTVSKKVLTQEHTSGHVELSSQIISDLVYNKYECSICMVLIKKNTAVWSCSRCYGIWHIFCAKKWARAGKDNASSNAPWNCPKCRAEYKHAPQSWCFCGKVKNPQNDLMKIPHSCGELCLKFRENTTCPHPCTLLCHPGPCPPCGSMGKMGHCFCGRSQYMLPCGVEDKGRSCDSTCDRLLNCGIHNCSDQCHDGECKKCSIMVLQKCFCGKLSEDRVCGSGVSDTSVYGKDDERTFSCNDECDRLLPCKNHKCKDKCHPGHCSDCLTDPNILKTCGCGRKPSTDRKSCLDPVENCGAICDRPMACGHKCKKVCHVGPCDDCQEDVDLKCRCGLSVKSVVCKNHDRNEIYLCNRVCTKKKSCGKHICALKCCPTVSDPTDAAGVHVCVTVCNKRLKCGSHSCKNLCHKGPCRPCLEADFNDKICSCGKTIQHAPIRCGTPPLECQYPCQKPRPCGHPITYHTCHYGECPPCVYLTSKLCACGKTMIENVKCFSNVVLCGKKCKKQMSCGLHACKRECHNGPCEKTNDAHEENGVRSCGHPCGRSLSTCKHACSLPCHPDEAECPYTECRQLSTVYCACKRIKKDIPCVGLEEITLDCDDLCAKELRKKQLALAFGIINDTTQPPRYSNFLIHIAQSTPNFAIQVEKLLEMFINAKAVKYTLPPYEKLQRQFIHELCKYYNIGTESFFFNGSTKKEMEITKKPNSQIPIVLLSDVSGINQKNNALSTNLLVYGLNKNVKTPDIHLLLPDFKNDFRVQWLDDESCLLIFNDHYKMMKALTSFNVSGGFKVKIHADKSIDTSFEGKPFDFVDDVDDPTWNSEKNTWQTTEYDVPEELADDLGSLDIEIPDDWSNAS